MGGRTFAQFGFYRRFPVDLGIPQVIAGLAEYRNLPNTIGAVVSASSDKAQTLVLLDTVLGLGDVYDILEVLSVDGYNQRLMNKRQADAYAH